MCAWRKRALGPSALQHSHTSLPLLVVAQATAPIQDVWPLRREPLTRRVCARSSLFVRRRRPSPRPAAPLAAKRVSQTGPEQHSITGSAAASAHLVSLHAAHIDAARLFVSPRPFSLVLAPVSAARRSVGTAPSFVSTPWQVNVVPQIGYGFSY